MSAALPTTKVGIRPGMARFTSLMFIPARRSLLMMSSARRPLYWKVVYSSTSILAGPPTNFLSDNKPSIYSSSGHDSIKVESRDFVSCRLSKGSRIRLMAVIPKVI